MSAMKRFFSRRLSELFPKIKSILLASAATILAGALVIYPEESFNASIRGLNMWWEIVFPSLLPFFILSEALIGFGVVRLIGVLLEPLMRPLFKVPGSGGFVWAMGMASGFPSGAKFTARLRQEKQITRIEAERLVSFTNNSNPLFIFGAVSVGFFNNPALGMILGLAHYLGNVGVGLMMRFYGKDKAPGQKAEAKRPTFKQALAEMHRTRLRENRPIGKLLGDAVLSSIQTLLMIGGFIILFSVVNKMLFHMNITGMLANGVQLIFQLLHLPSILSIPFISGIFEITLGSQMTSGAENAGLMYKAILVSFILGFSGFSVQAQVASILAETDIRFLPFFLARIVHGFLSGILVFLLWKPLYERSDSFSGFTDALPVFLSGGGHSINSFLGWLSAAGPPLTILSLMIYLIIWSSRQFGK